MRATVSTLDQPAICLEPKHDIKSETGCFTWNMGGWKAHEHILRDWLSQNEAHIGFIQETHLTSDGQATAERTLAKYGYRGAWSSPAELQRTRNGHLRVGWGTCPGVAIITKADRDVHVLRPKTKAAQQLVRGGRLILARALIAAMPILLVNLYAPAGKESVPPEEF